MFGITEASAVYLYRAPVDFRKAVNGLAALVERELKRDVFSGACFVFGNRRRDKVKILVWERTGFWLLYKRLERDRFIWPQADIDVVELTLEQLRWLLSGIDLSALRGHVSRVYRRAS